MTIKLDNGFVCTVNEREGVFYFSAYRLRDNFSQLYIIKEPKDWEATWIIFLNQVRRL